MFTRETAQQYLDYDHGALYLYRWTHEVPHVRGRNFYQHLRNCFTILVKLNCPRYLCIAGLWHSAYDTTGFENPLKEKFPEDIVDKFVGHEANELVKKFGALQQPRVDTIINLGDTDCAYLDWANCEDLNDDGMHDYNIKRLKDMIREHNAVY